MTKLLVATQNTHKLAEYRYMLQELGDMEWLSLVDLGLGDMEVEENGTTFAENARLKAYAYQQASGIITFADDSGLVVDALNDAPGIYSARYGLPDVTTDKGRYQFLLNNIADVPESERTARFMCTVAIALPEQALEEIPVVEGTVEGAIGYTARGDHGFGYDPIFQLSDGRMLAELLPAEKNKISHRANALTNALPLLRELLKA